MFSLRSITLDGTDACTAVRSGKALSTLLTPGIQLRPKSLTRYSLVFSLECPAVDATTTGTGVPLGEVPSTLLTSRYPDYVLPITRTTYEKHKNQKHKCKGVGGMGGSPSINLFYSENMWKWCLEDRRTTFLWGGHLFRVYVSFRGATLPSLFISDVLDDSFDVHLVMRSSAASAWRCNCVVSSAPVLRPFIILYTISARQCRWFKQRNFISVHGYEFGIRIAPILPQKIPQGDGLQVFWVSHVYSHQLILN